MQYLPQGSALEIVHGANHRFEHHLERLIQLTCDWLAATDVSAVLLHPVVNMLADEVIVLQMRIGRAHAVDLFHLPG